MYYLAQVPDVCLSDLVLPGQLVLTPLYKDTLLVTMANEVIACV